MDTVIATRVLSSLEELDDVCDIERSTRLSMADESRGRTFAVSFRRDAQLSFVILQLLSVINNNVAPRTFNVLKLTILAAYMK